MPSARSFGPPRTPGRPPRAFQAPTTPRYQLLNTAEGGTDGATVTAANSGGISGTAFGTISGVSIPTYKVAGSPIGNLQINVSHSAGSACFAGWDNGNFAAQPDLFVRAYFLLESFPTTANQRLIVFRDLSLPLASVILTTTGTWLIADASFATIATGVTALALGRWYRMEAHYSAAGQLLQARLFTNPNETTPVAAETLQGGTPSGGWAAVVRFGDSQTTSNTVNTDLDNLGLDTSDWCGPMGSVGAQAPLPAQRPRIFRPGWPHLPIPAYQQPTNFTVTVAPIPGALTLTGQTVQLTTTVAPSPGAITFTGATDVVLIATVDFVRPPLARVRIGPGWIVHPFQARQVPTPTVPASVTVNVDTPGALMLTGQTVQLTTTLAPAAGSLTLTGQSPVLIGTVAPSAGAITFTGQSVQLTTTLAVGAGAITFTGQTVILSVATVVSPTSGALTLTGQTVQLTTTLNAGASALTLTGQSVVLTRQVSPSPGALTLTGQTIVLSGTVAPSAGAITFTGQTVGLLKTVAVSPGALQLAGQAAALISLLQTSPGAITFTGQTVVLPPPLPPPAESSSASASRDNTAAAQSLGSATAASAREGSSSGVTRDLASRSSSPGVGGSALSPESVDTAGAREGTSKGVTRDLASRISGGE